MNTKLSNRTRLALNFAFACSAALGCGRDSTKAHVDKLENDVHAITQDVKNDAKAAAHDAKHGADEIVDTLPSADQVRDELNHTGDKLNAAAQRAKSELREARDKLRDQFSKSK